MYERNIKIINWQTSTIVFLGLFLSTFSGATHSLEWNRPIKCVDPVIINIILLSVVIFLALTERSKKKLSYLIGAMMASYLIGWEVMSLMLDRYFSDEAVWGCLILTIVYIAIALGINFLKNKIKTRKAIIIIISAFLLLDLAVTAHYWYSKVKQEEERKQRASRDLKKIGMELKELARNMRFSSEGFPEDFKDKKTDNK
jgi:hypothetical protein